MLNTGKRGLLQRIPFTHIAFTDTFWQPRLLRHQAQTINACMDQCERSGRLENIIRAGQKQQGGYVDRLFGDSDLYKVLEGVAYSLKSHPDAAQEARADGWIDHIAAAQGPDGYINSYFSLEAPDKRWTDMMAHEMYCIGHMIEAAIAYKEATGKTKLLGIAIRAVSECMQHFGPGKRHWISGHQEIELALMKLQRETGDMRYADFARWLIHQRGHGLPFTSIAWNREAMGGKGYNQDDVPVQALSSITGHAVRAMYYYTAIADLAALYGDETLMAPLNRLWDSVVNRNMYITGGIGASSENEGITADYDLPNETAYCETCASAGMVFWNHRMNLMTGDAKYADILELCMYNGVLSGISMDGTKFFYENPLASGGAHHRTPWFEVSCCPTQLARFIPSVGDYMYATGDETLYVNLYADSRASFTLGGRQIDVVQATGYPWDGAVHITLKGSADKAFAIKLRIPGWCRSFTAAVNGNPVQPPLEKGYLAINRRWVTGDTIALTLDMPIERIHARPEVTADIGRVALKRGPLVYCVEEADTPSIDTLTLAPQALLRTTMVDDSDLGHLIKIHGGEGIGSFTAIPYYAWDNRTPGQMMVWLPEAAPGAMPLYLPGTYR